MTRACFLLLPLVALLAGCASQVPIAANHPISTQKKAKAVHHWDVLADDVTSQTIQAMRVNLRATPGDPQAYRVEHGPGLRTILDLGDPARSRIVVSTGQSGLPLSPHYRNQMPLWAAGASLPLWPDRPAKQTLTLRAIKPEAK